MKRNLFKEIVCSILCISLIIAVWIWYEDYKIERNLPYLLTDEIKEESVRLLYIQWANNSYSVYPDGNYQEIKLSKEKQRKINDILYKLTKHTGQEIEMFSDSFKKRNLDWKKGWDKTYKNIPDDAIVPQIFKDFEYPSERDFLDYMDDVDDLIGGNSNYNRDYFKALIKNQSD